MGQCLSAVIKVLNAAEAQQQQEPEKQKPSYAAAAGTTTSSVPVHAPSSSSLLHSSLPPGAFEAQVRNVYDGDTLTLVDERRVRFLGIDTPEIKEQQPFAQEAKAYTKNLCDKKTIWISHEPGQEKEDHYGRLLAFVWVKQDGGYLCVNEGIVAAGLAQTYIPNQNSKLHNWDKLIALQDQARKAKKGLWSAFEDMTVVKTANGSAYHKRSCEHLTNIRNLTELKASQASAMGLHPCRTCLAD